MSARVFSRWQAAATHLLICLVIAAAVIALMLGVWYPGPLFEAAGGTGMLYILVGVDVILGPLLTLIVFKSGKRGMKFDLAVIGLVQIAALVYGVHIVYLARPAFMVFVKDRFELVTAVELEPDELAKAKYPQFRAPGWSGPELAAADMPADPKERSQLLETEAWKKRQEQEARDQEDALIRAKQRSGLVKNVKEHMANERELETNRKNAQAREEEAARLGTAVVTARTALTQHEADLNAMKSHVSEEELAARAQMSGVEEQIAAARTQREVAAARVDATAIKRYSSIRMRRGMALAAVKAGTCQGCHMNIPPQLFNILQRGLTIEVCPNCNRIIYWDRLLADPDGAVAEKIAKPAEAAPKRAPRAKGVKAAPGRPAHLPDDLPKPDAPRAPKQVLAPSAGSDLGAAIVPNAETLRSSSAAGPAELPSDDEPEAEGATDH